MLGLSKQHLGQVYTVTIPGDPIPWQRAGKSGARLYDKQKNEKILWGLNFMKGFSQEALTGPLSVDITFHMRVFQSLDKKYGQSIEGKTHYQVPDLSNLVKFLEDALNTVAWKDDALIAECHARKVWSYEPRTVITIVSLEDWRTLLSRTVRNLVWPSGTVQ